MIDTTPINITILISGTGTNLQALIDATTTTSHLPSCQITHVISNKKNVPGLNRAKAAGIDTTVLNLVSDGYTAKGTPATPAARSAYDADLAALILAVPTDLVVCAGFMHILSPAFLTPLSTASVPVINLHPALPGQYSGTNAIQRAWQDCQDGKADRTGVMIHYVIQEVDMGECIIEREVEMREVKTLEGLEVRMHEAEHIAIVEGTGKAVERVRAARRVAGEGGGGT